MASPDHEKLITKLESQAPLRDDDKAALATLPLFIKKIPARGDIVRQGDRPSHCCLLLDGWLHRHKTLPHGRRQVLSYHLPGDIPDLQSLHLPVMDHTLSAIVDSQVALIPHKAVHDVLLRHPGIAAALWRETLSDAAIFREWIVNMGGRGASERIAHLICELFVRLTSIGLAKPDGFTLLLTQAEIGDACGLTPVHISRCMKEVRTAGLIEIKDRFLLIRDWKRLQKFASFNPGYLHLREPGEQSAAMTEVIPAASRRVSDQP